ncbi:hypothetical protein DFH28DRAFT_1150858 [Melampsora americana]|nr:hypothetical protein DFH28DRAFT_1150858 [Melampsora americana]
MVRLRKISNLWISLTKLKNINLVRQKYPDVASMLPDLFRRQTPSRSITSTASPTTVATRPPNAQTTPSSPTNLTGTRPSQSASSPRASTRPAATPASTNNRNVAQQNPTTSARPAQVVPPSATQRPQTNQPSNPPAGTTPPNNFLLVVIGVIIFKIRSSKRQHRLSAEQSQQTSSQFHTSQGPHSMDYIRQSEDTRPSLPRPPPTFNTTYPPLPPPGRFYPGPPNHNMSTRESMEFYNPRPPPPILPRHEYNPHPREKEWRREPSTYNIDNYYRTPASIASPTGQYIDARYTINDPDYDVMHPDERPYDPRYTLDGRGKLRYEIEENSSLGPPRSRYDSYYYGRGYREEPEGSDIDAQSSDSYYIPEQLEVPHHTPTSWFESIGPARTINLLQ